MSISNKDLRYAHCEGHTSLCYDAIREQIITCGSDGEVRVWKGIDDDDAKTYSICRKASAVTVKDDHVFVATDTNAVQMLNSADFGRDGVATTFTAPVTHMNLNKKGSMLAAASCDFTIRIVDIATHEFDIIQGHQAPVLCVAWDKDDEFLISSSCDGTVKVWKISDLSCVKTWSVLPKSNSFNAMKTLGRLSWEPMTGRYFTVPVEKEVRVFEHGTWAFVFSLTDSTISSTLFITSFSPCGSYVAASDKDGSIFIWNFAEKKCIDRKTNDKKITICSLEWNPSKAGEIALCDVQGHLCILSDLNLGNSSNDNILTEAEILAQFADQFDVLDDSDNENSFSISQIKAETVGLLTDLDDEKPTKQKSYLDDFLLDDNSRGSGKHDTKSEVDETESTISALKPVRQPVCVAQPPFQPGSTPVHLQHRFMLWNSVGVIFCYNTHEETSIDIEFHDTAVHHAMHVSNIFNYTMAALSVEAAVFASVSQNDTLSKLTCMHFASWDSCKDWNVDMPVGEEIEGVAIGNGWAAVATNLRNLRLFTVGGNQREVLSIPGQFVSMAGFESYLVVAYHAGAGLFGDQCLSAMVFNVISRSVILPGGTPLPLYSKSTLVWIGFTDEGTPTVVDSAGVVRMLSPKYKTSWCQVANTKLHTKGKSDNHFVVGVNEAQQQIRSILCKGSRYPPTLPRPVVTVLPLQLPLCELTTEKAEYEEAFWRHKMLEESFAYHCSEGFQLDPAVSETAAKTQQESLLKMFALACRADHEFRASEVAQLMASSHAVQLAIKYASRLRHNQLAQRLGDTVYSKLEEETSSSRETAGDHQKYDDEKDGFHYQRKPPLVHVRRTRSQVTELDEEPIASYGTDEEEEDEAHSNNMPLRKRQTSPFSVSDNADHADQVSESATSPRKNPFKVNLTSSQALESSKCTDMFDQMKKPVYGQKKSSEITSKKELVKRKSKTPKQTVLFSHNGNPENTDESTNKQEPIKKSGFQLWFESVKEDLKDENSNLDEFGLTKLATNSFRALPEEEIEEWKKKASAASRPHKRKRKLLSGEHENNNDKTTDTAETKEPKPTVATKKARDAPKKQTSRSLSESTSAKLTSFMFKKY